MKKSKPLEIVERIVRNLPIEKPEFLVEETAYGKLYLALGEDHEGCYHGAWAFTEGPGICQVVTFAKNQPRRGVLNVLRQDGFGVMSDLQIRGMLTREYWESHNRG